MGDAGVSNDWCITVDMNCKRYTSKTSFSCLGYKCYIDVVNIQYGERAFCAVAPRLWNGLPLDIRSINSLELFKKITQSISFYSIVIL